PYKRQNQCSVCSSVEGFLRFSRFRDRPTALAAETLCCVFTLSGVPRPAKSAVCVDQIGVKPVLLFPV
ncbi:hypothetical protein, partial [Nocardiopsis ganjiahuensis]|uniref:hypothetical protein n=1 Tax=Nocardiopsis ganjiahuensis TaxID=239984 RepID=UPI0019554385